MKNKRKFALPTPVYTGRQKTLGEILEEEHKNDVDGPAKLDVPVIDEEELELGLLIEDFKGVTEEVTIDFKEDVVDEEEIPEE